MKIQDRYEYDPQKDLLGKGGFARVFRAQDTLLHREVALKVFSNAGTHQYSVLAEIRKVIGLEHPNLLRYYDVVMLEGQNPLGESEQTQIGVMELANAGDLKDFARANPGSPMLYKLLKDVLLGLEYLHSKGIIHRDLKAQNILLVKQDGVLTAKISDFGISKDTGSGGQSSSMMVGTIEYMAPEQFSPAKYGIDGKVGSNLDLWSFGIMVHELLTNTTPFGSRDGDTTAEQIMSQILSTEMPDGIEKLPEPYKSVVKKCLVTNAKERIRRASELVNYFEHDTPLKSAAQSSQVDDNATKMYPKGGGDVAQTADPLEQVTKAFGDKQSSTEPTSMEGKRRNLTAGVAMAAAVMAIAGGAWWYSSVQQAKALAQTVVDAKAAMDAKAAADDFVAAQAKTEADARVKSEIEVKAKAKAKLESEIKAKLETEKSVADGKAKLAAEVKAGHEAKVKVTETSSFIAPTLTTRDRKSPVGYQQWVFFCSEKPQFPSNGGAYFPRCSRELYSYDASWNGKSLDTDDDHPLGLIREFGGVITKNNFESKAHRLCTSKGFDHVGGWPVPKFTYSWHAQCRQFD